MSPLPSQLSWHPAPYAGSLYGVCPDWRPTMGTLHDVQGPFEPKARVGLGKRLVGVPAKCLEVPEGEMML